MQTVKEMMFAEVGLPLALAGSARPALDVDILTETVGYDAHTRYGYSGSRGIPFTRTLS